jgi:ribosomal protein S7
LCDLSKVSTYKENIQKLVSEIIDNKNDKKVTATKKREQTVKIVPKSKVNKNSVD